VSTANFAELYYRLAKHITTAGMVPLDNLSASFFSQLGIDASTAPAAVGAALHRAADQMLQAIVFHSDHLELSEQFDRTTGYQKSVSNHSWSYASFLSAMRVRAQAAEPVPTVSPPPDADKTFSGVRGRRFPGTLLDGTSGPAA
jgi:glucoamylase